MWLKIMLHCANAHSVRFNAQKAKIMIPQKLQIKNFISYGPNLQTIDFTNYSLICLSGKNGHGKSAFA
jgi:hypothetical protein